MKVMGIDIVKGSPLSKTNPPFYSVVIIDDRGRILYESVESPLKTVVRLVWEYEVFKIGIDNVYELASTKRDVAKIMLLLPSGVSIYQVTLEENKFVNIYKQAMKIGIELSSKPKPLQTAYVCALLALNDVGTPIKGVERRTKIVVSRNRSVGPGGSSANKFARGMRTAILCAVREIKKLLDEAAVPYDIVFRRGSGGLDSAVFIAYTGSDVVKKIIKPFNGRDIKVTIKSEYSTVEFFEKELNRKHVIVGIDPGIETGVAILDLSLKNVFLFSSRDLDKISVINKVYSIGTPIIVSTDKSPAPDTVKKISSLLGIPLYEPPQSLTNEEKERLIEWLKKKGIEINLRTSHERDALAAAIKFYKSFERKFIELERRVDELGLEVDIDELKLLLLKGRTINDVIEYAIEEHLENEVYHLENMQILSIPTHISVNSCNEKLRNLEDRIRELIKEREILRARINELETRIGELEFELKFNNKENSVDREIIRDRIINELRESLRNMQNKIAYLASELEQEKTKSKAFYGILRGFMLDEYLAIPKIRSLTIGDVREINAMAALPRAVLIESYNLDANALNAIKESGTALIFNACINEIKQLLLDIGIPVVCNLPIQAVYEDIAIVSTKEFENALENALKEVEFHRKSKENKNYIDSAKLLDIINEYRKNVWNT
ncbi:MAG: DUF460 domain-containing protein [Sulfolobales archaeon]|nr:DUF460 domain-containing protein [Ignisphaera sp.]MCX8199760.1 DUF460 domain-containing protein [Sulfolobales archaeon]MDW8085003.1 DUF460 domain-containing protein [Ignisphaera sp.]